MTTEITRENVQHILDHNAAEYKRKEADLYEQERQLRLTINDNHATKTASKAQKAQKKAKEEAEALAKRQQKQAYAAKEAAQCRAWYRFMLGAFSPILIAAPLIAIAGSAPITILAAFLTAAFTLLVIVAIIKAFFPFACISRKAAEACVEVKDIINHYINRKGENHHGN